MTRDLEQKIREILAVCPRTDDDKLDRRMRWVAVMRAAVEAGQGDILEIGALAGDSTVMFCVIAEEFGRHVTVIDPWLAPTHDVAGWEKAEFEKRTKKWREMGLLYVLESVSQEAYVVRKIEAGQWAFALVDGSHKHGNVLQDIWSVKDARVICCDDMDRPGVRQAFNEGLLTMPGRVGILAEGLGRKWEGYIV
jgi:hypothetical protein